MIPLSFDIKLFLFLSVAFSLSTIIGTVTHEYGHYTVAKSLGYSSTVSYGYTNWEDRETKSFIDSLDLYHSKELDRNLTFPGKKEYDSIQNKQEKDAFWIILGGPMQTMITGTIGILLLFTQKSKIIKTKSINLFQWICIFLSLFWLRQVANLVAWTIAFLLTGKFSLVGDEVGLAVSLKLPISSIAVCTGITGLAVLLYIIFAIIPTDKRITFISSGLLGGISGYMTWLVWLGPIIMP